MSGFDHFRKDDRVEFEDTRAGQLIRLQGTVTRIIDGHTSNPLLAIRGDDEGQAVHIRNALAVIFVDRPAPDPWVASAPEGFYRDSSGTLHRQHDLLGGPHDKPPAPGRQNKGPSSLPRTPEGHEIITRDDLEVALRDMGGIEVTPDGRGLVEYPDLTADAIFRWAEEHRG